MYYLANCTQPVHYCCSHFPHIQQTQCHQDKNSEGLQCAKTSSNTKSTFTDEQVITTLEAAKWSCIFLCHLSCKHLQNTWLQVQKLIGCVFILPFAFPCARHPTLHGVGFECSSVFLQSSWSGGPMGRMLLTPRSGRGFPQAPCRKGETTPKVPHSSACNPRRLLVTLCGRQSQRSFASRNERVTRMPKANGLHFSLFLVSKNKTKQHQCD